MEPTLSASVSGKKKFGIALILLALVVLAVGYFLNQGGSQMKVNKDGELPKVVAGAFSREEALAKLSDIETKVNFSFSKNSPRDRILVKDLPDEIFNLLSFAGGEILLVESESGGASYYVHFINPFSLADSYINTLKKISTENIFKIISAFRDPLASMTIVESSNYSVRLSQVAVDENKTEVFLSAVKK